MNNRRVINRRDLVGREPVSAHVIKGIQAEQKGTGVPTLGHGQPLPGKEVIQHVLIPMAEAMGMGAREGPPPLQQVHLPPALQINQHHPGIELLAKHIAMIQTTQFVLTNGGQGMILKRCVPERANGINNNGIAVDKEKTL